MAVNSAAVIGGLAGGVGGGYLVSEIIMACKGSACLAAAAEFAFIDIVCIALGAVAGVALVGLLIWGVVNVIDSYTMTTDQREFKALKQKVEVLKKTAKPTLVNIRDIRMKLVGVLSEIVPDGDSIECHVCKETMTNCATHPPEVHINTCAVLPFSCPFEVKHPICRGCAPYFPQCGICRAPPAS
jgi:hypothetical protein